MIVEVTLLDGTVVKYDLDGKGKGLDLLEKVADQLQLIEKDYFGFLQVTVLLVRGTTKTSSHSFVTLSLRTNFRYEMELLLKINATKYSTSTATLCPDGEQSCSDL